MTAPNATMSAGEVLEVLMRRAAECRSNAIVAEKRTERPSVAKGWYESEEETLAARAAVAAMAEREAALLKEHEEDQGVIAVWRGRCERAEAERDALIAENEALRPVVNPGEVLVEVHGLTGSGKSAVAGEIEILCKALGLDVRWENGDEEKFLTHADWTAALELYTPRVRIVEINTPRPAAIDAARTETRHG